MSSEDAQALSGFVYVIVLPPQVNVCLFDFILPQIGQPTIGAATAGQSVAVSAAVSDNVGVGVVSLLYRPGGGNAFTTAGMVQSGAQYAVEIPAAAVGPTGVEYKIRALDVCNLEAILPSTGVQAVRVDVGGDGAVASASQPSGSAATAYRLVSFPLELANASRSVVVEDDLGAYDNTEWRMFALSSNQSYAEQPASIQAGRGYWLIAKDGGRLDTGPGKSFASNTAFSVNLNAGWTFIGNPFTYDIPFSQLTLESGEALDIRSYTGSWGGASTPLRPFAGYAVTNETQSTDRLFIDPLLSPAKTSGGRVAEAAEDLEWSLTVSAASGEARDSDNVLGVSASAADAWDVLDRPEPPVIGDYVTVYFPHDEWETPLKRYRTDIRTPVEDGARWPIHVETAVAGEVSMTFEGLDAVPRDYDVWLVDALVKSRHNLREAPGYRFTSDGAHPRNLVLVVGPSDYVRKSLDADAGIPQRFVLDQNFPNPFNPTTTIRYGLSEPGTVSLYVFDMLGRRIATLLEDVEHKEGYDAVVWDGRDSMGIPVSSGVYLYRLETENRILSRKMLLLK